MTTSPRSEGPLSQSVERLRTELDRWMDAAWSQGEKAMDVIGRRTGRRWSPPVDVLEDFDSVRVLVNLPGVETSEIDLTLTGHMLTVSGLLPGTDVGEHGAQHAAERPVGEFHRAIPLPACVDPEQISANCRHGVLTVIIAKNEQQKARKIPIQPANASESSGTTG